MQKIKTFVLNGISSVETVVECETMPGIGIHVVGLADTSLRESLLRIATALQSKGFSLPGKKIVINIAPANLRKNGSPSLDLPIALAILIESGQVKPAETTGQDCLELPLAAVGELALNGDIRPIRGTVSMVDKAFATGIKNILIPMQNKEEETDWIWDDNTIVGIRNLEDAINFIEKGTVIKSTRKNPSEESFSPVKMSEKEVRAIEIAAAGGHNILLMGQPGTRKGAIAEVLSRILPNNKLNNGKIASLCGLKDIVSNPFRTPHYSASAGAFLGDSCGPGELTKANGGVLFINEFEQMPIAVQNRLKEVINDITTLHSTKDLPGQTLLALGSLPCDCGYYGDGERCQCTEESRVKHLRKIKRGLYECIDIQLWTSPNNDATESIDEGKITEIRNRILKARELQKERYQNESFKTNSELKGIASLNKFCPETDSNKDFLYKIMERCGLYAESYKTILRIARTIADLDGKKDIDIKHLAEAVGYRFLDKE